MQIRESEWLRDQLARLPDDALFPLLDVGSSTLAYRTQVQPYVEANLFQPLKDRGGRIWHADVKPEDGVDLVGDLLDPAFRKRLAELGVRSAMVCNVLQHLTDREVIARAIGEIIPPEGYIIVSGPHRYPRHFDPIDTMFRPDPEDVAELFPGTEIIASAIINSGNWRQWDARERGGRGLSRAILRLGLPFYRPRKWWELACHVPYFFKHIKAFGVVLRKLA